VKLIQDDSTGTYGYTDSTGTVSGLVPVNEVLLMKVFNPCGAFLYSVSIGPFSANTNLGNIHIANGNCNPPTPVAGFTYSVGNTSLPVTITFTNTSINATSWLWKFGDSTSSTDQNPAHTYNVAGDFPVYLTATGTSGSNTVSQVIHISGTPAPVAGFSYAVGNTSLPVIVTFTNTSTNAAGWLWNFGDGTTSAVQNPIHTYTTSGDFPVLLKVTGTDGSRDSAIQVIHISGGVNDSYINLTLGGITYSWAYPNITAYHSVDSAGTYIYGPGSGNNWISFYTLNENASPGNYIINLSATLNGISYKSDSAYTIITAYGAPGENIVGTAYGQMRHDSTGSSPFSMSYMVKRNR
jgi:PKD repeat protein